MKNNKLGIVLLFINLLIIAFIFYVIGKKLYQVLYRDSKLANHTTLVVKEVLATYKSQMENDLSKGRFIDTSKYQIKKRHDDFEIIILDNGGVIIQASLEEPVFIYLFPEKEDDQYIWHCIGVPRERVPEFCRNSKD